MGIPSVQVMMFKELAERTKPPRTLHVRFPFGRPFGEPGNQDAHRVILQDALRMLETASSPGTIVSAPYLWRREDYASILKERAAVKVGAEHRLR